MSWVARWATSSTAYMTNDDLPWSRSWELSSRPHFPRTVPCGGPSATAKPVASCCSDSAQQPPGSCGRTLPLGEEREAPKFSCMAELKKRRAARDAGFHGRAKTPRPSLLLVLALACRHVAWTCGSTRQEVREAAAKSDTEEHRERCRAGSAAGGCFRVVGWG